MHWFGTNPESVDSRPLGPEAHTTHMEFARLVSCLCVLSLLALLLTGCGLFRFLSHDPTEDIKGAASDVSSGVKESAREYEEKLRDSGDKFREEIREDVSRIAQSTDNLVAVAKESPDAVGEAISRRVLQDENIQRTLKSVTALSRSGDRLVSAAEHGPVLLADKISELQTELTKADGFLSQQRDAIVGELRKERAAVTDVISHERAAAMKDLDAYTSKVIQEVSAQLRTLLGTAILGTVLLILVILGLPFVAGYLLGRQIRAKSDRSHA